MRGKNAQNRKRHKIALKSSRRTESKQKKIYREAGRILDDALRSSFPPYPERKNKAWSSIIH